MKILIVLLIISLASCNVAKKVFRHKDSSIVKVKKDSTGSTQANIDTSKQSSHLLIRNTEIVRDGGTVSGHSSVDMDQLKTANLKGKPLVIPILDSVGKAIGLLSVSLNPLTNALDQAINMNVPPVHEKTSEKDSGNTVQKGISDLNQNSALKAAEKNKKSNNNQVKEVKRSPAWVKWALIISAIVLVLYGVYKRGNIWQWIKNKLLKK